MTLSSISHVRVHLVYRQMRFGSPADGIDEYTQTTVPLDEAVVTLNESWPPAATHVRTPDAVRSTTPVHLPV